jgi:hypothetical protein
VSDKFEQGKDPGILFMSAQLTALHEDIGEMKMALGKLTDAITKLALIEQQQAYAAQAHERAVAALDDLEKRVGEIEKRMPEMTRTSVWVDRAVWATAAAAVVYVLKATRMIS